MLFSIFAVMLPETCKQTLMCEISGDLYVKDLNISSINQYSHLERRTSYFMTNLTCSLYIYKWGLLQV